jgi:hypothetical protein
MMHLMSERHIMQQTTFDPSRIVDDTLFPRYFTRTFSVRRPWLPSTRTR